MRNFDLVEEEESIVHGVITKLRSNISHVNTFEGFMRLQVSDLANKWMWTVWLAGNDELRHNDRMVGCSA